MANCKDCIHYEPCFEYGNILDPVHGGVKCDSFKPAADFAPKSEYCEVLENWQKIHDSYTTDCIYHYNKGRQEVAREIFEEIYKTMNSVYASVQHSCVGMHGDNPETMRLLGKLNGVKHLGDELAELKKKYTEEHKNDT